MCSRRALALSVILGMAGRAHAQKAEADAAFRRGRALMAEGEIAKACTEFEASMRLEPQHGTLYNLALCHQAIGKLASAWTEFNELAETDKNAARAKDSARRAARLQKRLTRMRLVIVQPIDGLVIERDGLDVTTLAGNDVPVDPGRYTFMASAPSHESATLEVDLTTPGKTVDVVVPALQPVRAAALHGVDAWPDPYALVGTLRPLVLPRRVWEATAYMRWRSRSPDGGSDPRDSVEGIVAVRRGFGRIEVTGALDLHLRYEQVEYRPTLVRGAAIGATYIITPMFAVRTLYRRYHPLGGDIDTGSDVRIDLTRKHVVTPKVALVGRGGVAFDARDTRGSSPTSEFAIQGIGAVQLAPLPRLTLEANAVARIYLGGELYDHTFELDVGAIANVAIDRRMDAFAQIMLDATPSSNARTIVLGVNQRIP